MAGVSANARLGAAECIMEEKLLIVGVNHRTAPVAVRERLAYGDGEIAAALARLSNARRRWPSPR